MKKIEGKGGTYEAAIHFIIYFYVSDGFYRNDWIMGFSAAGKTIIQI